MNTYAPVAIPALLLAGVPPLTAVTSRRVTPPPAQPRLNGSSPSGPKGRQWHA